MNQAFLAGFVNELVKIASLGELPEYVHYDDRRALRHLKSMGRHATPEALIDLSFRKDPKIRRFVSAHPRTPDATRQRLLAKTSAMERMTTVIEGMEKVAISARLRGSALAERVSRSMGGKGGRVSEGLYNRALDALNPRVYKKMNIKEHAQAALPHFEAGMKARGWKVPKL
jgi:hypothetical protein